MRLIKLIILILLIFITLQYFFEYKKIIIENKLLSQNINKLENNLNLMEHDNNKLKEEISRLEIDLSKKNDKINSLNYELKKIQKNDNLKETKNITRDDIILALDLKDYNIKNIIEILLVLQIYPNLFVKVVFRE